MTTDDNNSELEQLKIDRQISELFRRHTDRIGNVRMDRKDPGGTYKRVLEALIVLAVAALIGAVWNLTQTATLLQASQAAQRRDIDRIERRQDALEGKITRGGPDALDQ